MKNKIILFIKVNALSISHSFLQGAHGAESLCPLRLHDLCQCRIPPALRSALRAARQFPVPVFRIRDVCPERHTVKSAPIGCFPWFNLYHGVPPSRIPDRTAPGCSCRDSCTYLSAGSRGSSTDLPGGRSGKFGTSSLALSYLNGRSASSSSCTQSSVSVLSPSPLALVTKNSINRWDFP